MKSAFFLWTKLSKKLAIVAIASLSWLSNCFSISFIFDYSLDTYGFFTTERQQIVSLAGQTFTNLLIDRDSIIPSGINTWNWTFTHPSTGNPYTIQDPTIGAGQLRIYLGARSLGNSTLGQGGGVSWSASGTASWIQEISNTNTPTAYKPFAGAISLSTDINWYSGISDAVPSNQFDLFSVVLHEIGHVLGIGISTVQAWNNNINSSNQTFIGSNAVALYGSPIPLESDYAHFLQGTTYNGTSFNMVPALTPGTRRYFTAPELAALVDMGYVLIPEPSANWLLLIAIPLLPLGKKNASRWRNERLTLRR